MRKSIPVKIRKQISGIQERLKKIFIYRLALKYGLVEEKNNKIVFYFEKTNLLS